MKLHLIALLALAAPLTAQAPIVEVAKLYSSTATSNDFVATCAALDGGRLLIGARGQGASGAAYVFALQANGSWLETQELLASDAQSADSFGNAVDVSGNRALVGSLRADVAGLNDRGAAYVFEANGGPFVEVAKLVPSSAKAFDEAGFAVALDGDTAVVAAPKNDDLFLNAGKAWVFERDAGGAWNEVQTLTASNASESDDFGWSVAVAGDVLVVGAARQATASGSAYGAVYVFERQGGVWVETQILTTSQDTALDYFGWSVDTDGARIVVGAYNDETFNEPFGTDEGAAYLYERNGGGWVQAARFEAADADPADEFGYDVAIDGERVLVGAWNDSETGADAGAAYLYAQSGAGWSETKLLASEGQAHDLFGRAVALSGDLLAVGASNDDDNGSNAGAVYVFDAQPLSGNVSGVSVTSGGAQVMRLDAGHAFAGQPYLLAGSVTGTAPGLPIPGGWTVPLNNDAYLMHTITNLNAPPLAGNLGLLNGFGHGSCTFGLPAGTNPAFVGITAHHAFVTIDPLVGVATFVSNALPVSIWL